MSEAAKVAGRNGEGGSFVPRIRELLERGDIKGARRILAEAERESADEPGLPTFAKLLAPMQGRSVDVRDRDRTPEFEWLATEGASYRGQWVALLGGDLVAHADSLTELRSKLEQRAPDAPVLLHYVR